MIKLGKAAGKFLSVLSSDRKKEFTLTSMPFNIWPSTGPAKITTGIVMINP